jgi:hypothetical protein
MDLEGGHFETSSVSDAELEQLLESGEETGNQESDTESGDERELELV